MDSRTQQTNTVKPVDETGQIDVIIAAWNRADTIERAIRSVANDPAVRSVTVVDDASTDNTADCVHSLLGELPKLSLIRLPRNLGPSAARNVAIAIGDAPWIAILDGDDYLQPGRFTKLLTQSEHADFVADDLLQIDENAPAAAMPRALLQIDDRWPTNISLSDFVLGNISRSGRHRREMGFLKPIMRRSFLAQHGLRYDEAVRLGEDYLLYATALAVGARFRLMPAAGYVAVMRGTSISGQHSRQDLEALLRGDRHLADMPDLQPKHRRIILRHCRHIDGKIRWLTVIEAVKGRDLVKFLKAFWAAPEVGFYLLGKLYEQFQLRTGNRLRRLLGALNAE